MCPLQNKSIRIYRVLLEITFGCKTAAVTNTVETKHKIIVVDEQKPSVMDVFSNPINTINITIAYAADNIAPKVS